jgi:hypothetical protein
MDNPFAIGDLVHIPSGVILYKPILPAISRSGPFPAKASEKPTVGLVLNKDIMEYYKVSIGQEEYLLKKEDMVLIRKGGK